MLPLPKYIIFIKLYILPYHIIQINFWVTNLYKKERIEYIMKLTIASDVEYIYGFV